MGYFVLKNIMRYIIQARNVCLIPKSAHGTNFASAATVNMKIEDLMTVNLKTSLNLSKNIKTLACLMITIPNTSGMYQENIEDITKVIHDNGGLVYGANMNALVVKLNQII